MGRRRKKVVKLPKKSMPTVFLCPSCGKESVKVTIMKGEDLAVVRCGNCGLTDKVQIKSVYGEVDAYCLFVDSYYANMGVTPSVPGKGKS